jgi:hypothetical protein
LENYSKILFKNWLKKKLSELLGHRNQKDFVQEIIHHTNRAKSLTEKFNDQKNPYEAINEYV